MWCGSLQQRCGGWCPQAGAPSSRSDLDHMTTGTCTSACRGPRTALRHNPRAHKVIIAAAGTAQRRAVGTHLRTFDLSIHYNLNVVFLLCCQGHPGQLPNAGRRAADRRHRR